MAHAPTQESVLPTLPHRPWRRRWIFGGLAGLAAAIVVGGYFYDAPNRMLRQAIAETDRLDAGWRLEDIERARAKVPDAENGAALVLNAAAQIPANWLSATGGNSPGLEERLQGLLPLARPNAADGKELQAELAKVAPAIDVARELADRPQGRYSISWTKDMVGTLLPHVQDARNVARLLSLDALRRSLDNDPEGALRSCQAALNAGRSIGDEPTAVSQLVRAACARMAVIALEQTLSRGEANPKALEALQHLLEREAAAPLHLIAARSCRLIDYRFMQSVANGQFDRANYNIAAPRLSSILDYLVEAPRARQCLAPYLLYWNEVVEIAKLPTEVQLDRIGKLARPTQEPPAVSNFFGAGFVDWQKIAENFIRSQAQMRCAIVIVASERFRLAEGRWPDSLDALMPRYLPAVPANPYTGQPLGFRRLADGLVIYAVGPDGADYHDNLERKLMTTPGNILGFQLWDASVRRPGPGKR